MKAYSILSWIIFAVGVIMAIAYGTYRVRNLDTKAPEIQMDQTSIEVSVSATEEELLAGVTASDNKDGDVTGSLMVEGMSDFTSPGQRQMNIVAFDSSNNVAHAKRTIIYTDYQSPRFTITTPLVYQVTSSSASLNLTARVDAEDSLDGDLSNRVVAYNADEDNPFDVTSAGSYPVTFSVSDSAGDVAEFTATVQVVNSSTVDATVELTDNLIYLPVGATFNPGDYIRRLRRSGKSFVATSVNEDGETIVNSAEAFGLELDNPVDTNTPGWYEVKYSISDDYGGTATRYLQVCVEGA